MSPDSFDDLWDRTRQAVEQNFALDVKPDESLHPQAWQCSPTAGDVIQEHARRRHSQPLSQETLSETWARAMSTHRSACGTS